MIRLLAAAAVLASPLPVLLAADETTAEPQARMEQLEMIGADKPVLLGRMVVTATALEE